jgi:hypothetical protein
VQSGGAPTVPVHPNGRSHHASGRFLRTRCTSGCACTHLNQGCLSVRLDGLGIGYTTGGWLRGHPSAAGVHGHHPKSVRARNRYHARVCAHRRKLCALLRYDVPHAATSYACAMYIDKCVCEFSDHSTVSVTNCVDRCARAVWVRTETAHTAFKFALSVDRTTVPLTARS